MSKLRLGLLGVVALTSAGCSTAVPEAADADEGQKSLVGDAPNGNACMTSSLSSVAFAETLSSVPAFTFSGATYQAEGNRDVYPLHIKGGTPRGFLSGSEMAFGSGIQEGALSFRMRQTKPLVDSATGLAGSSASSGMVFAQVGLKLRAKNTCNVVYVMYRMAAATYDAATSTWSDGIPLGNDWIVIGVKKNPGCESSSQCETGGVVTGYSWIKYLKNIPELEEGHARTLRAVLHPDHSIDVYLYDEQPNQPVALIARTSADPAKRVKLDQHSTNDSTPNFSGSVGFRSDNVVFDIETLQARKDQGNWTRLDNSVITNLLDGDDSACSLDSSIFDNDGDRDQACSQ